MTLWAIDLAAYGSIVSCEPCLGLVLNRLELKTRISESIWHSLGRCQSTQG